MLDCDWSSDVCSSDLIFDANVAPSGIAGSYNLLVYLATTADRRTITAGSFGP
jgi:hypothetical protein